MIVDRENRIVDTGYNGPPRGFNTFEHTPCTGWCRRAQTGRGDVTYDDCVALHAEQNALMFSDRVRRVGGTIYVSSGVCGTCAKLIANSGLDTVVMEDRPGTEHRRTDEWCEFMEQCGLTVVTVVT